MDQKLCSAQVANPGIVRAHDVRMKSCIFCCNKISLPNGGGDKKKDNIIGGKLLSRIDGKHLTVSEPRCMIDKTSDWSSFKD